MHINVHWCKPIDPYGTGGVYGGQCRTVHEEKPEGKPQSPCFLYGVNKNYACTGKGKRRHNFALFVPRHSGEQTLRDVMQLIEVAKVSFQLETSS